MDDGRLLATAAKYGRTDTLTLLLAIRQSQLNTKDPRGRSLLSLAAGNGHVATVKLLMAQKSIEIESRDELGRTALSWAAGNGHESVIQALLGISVDENKFKDAQGRESRMDVAGSGDSSRYLPPHLSKIGVMVDSRDEYGRTPLSWAASEGHEEAVRLLLSQNTYYKEALDREGRSPLSWAAAMGHATIVRMLLEAGLGSIYEVDDDEESPLSWAAAFGHEEVIKILLERKGDFPNHGDSHGQRPMFWAAVMGQTRIVERLFSAYPDVELDKKKIYGQTLLSWVTRLAFEDSTRRFLRLQPSSSDFGALEMVRRMKAVSASAEDYAKIARLLFASNKVDINSRDICGRTPLSWAALNGNLTLVDILLGHEGVDVNSVDKRHMTPLHLAVGGTGSEPEFYFQREIMIRSRYISGSYGIASRVLLSLSQPASDLEPTAQQRAAVVQRLLKEPKVDPEIGDELGRTAFELAKRLGQTEVARALVKRSAIDTEAQNGTGEKALPDAVTDSPHIVPEEKDMGKPPMASIRSIEAVQILANTVAEVVLRPSNTELDIAAFVLEQELPLQLVLERFNTLLTTYRKDIRSTARMNGQVPVASLLEDAEDTISRVAESFFSPRRPDALDRSDPQEDPTMKKDAHLFKFLDSQSAENISVTTDKDMSPARAFLVDGRPMAQFRSNMCKFVSQTAWERAISQTSGSPPTSLPDCVDLLLGGLPFQLWEPVIPSGKRRVKWTCSCGMKLYDDFNQDCGEEALNELERSLNARESELADSGGEKAMVPRFGQHLYLSFSKCAESIASLVRPPKQPVLPSHHLKPSTAASQRAAIELDSLDPLYLLHCRSSGRYGIDFYQDLICDDMNDRTMFEFLRSVLRRAQAGNKWLTLRNTTSITLSKFHIDHSLQALVDYCEGCTQQRAENLDCFCVPPPELIGKEYKCHPTPPKRRPPFGKNYLMHYLLFPDHLSREQTWAFKQLPKRMGGPLQLDPEYTATGWGLHFEDGWNFRTIYILLFLANVIGSLVFGICWSVFKMDVQGAFGITSYWMGVVAIGMGGLALSSTHQL